MVGTTKGILKEVSCKSICVGGCKNSTKETQDKTCLNRVNNSYFRGTTVTGTAPLLGDSSRMGEEEWRRGGRQEQTQPPTPFPSLMSVLGVFLCPHERLCAEWFSKGQLLILNAVFLKLGFLSFWELLSLKAQAVSWEVMLPPYSFFHNITFSIIICI